MPCRNPKRASASVPCGCRACHHHPSLPVFMLGIMSNAISQLERLHSALSCLHAGHNFFEGQVEVANVGGISRDVSPDSARKSLSGGRRHLQSHVQSQTPPQLYTILAQAPFSCTRHFDHTKREPKQLPHHASRASAASRSTLGFGSRSCQYPVTQTASEDIPPLRHWIMSQEGYKESNTQPERQTGVELQQHQIGSEFAKVR